MSKGQKKRLFDFKHEWLNLYGLQITARDTSTSEVMSIKCRFCEFGRDEVGDGEERQRKRTKHIKFYKKPWRSDNIKCHVEEQHKVRYAEYVKLTLDDKKNYFMEAENARPLAGMIRNDQADTMAKEMIIFNISCNVVKIIIHQLLLDYDPDDAEDNIPATADDIFTLVGDEGDDQHYEASWSNKLQFKMIVSHISVGISFLQCSKLLLQSKEFLGLGALGNISIGKVIQVVRYTCAFNYEIIRKVLHHVWAFSIAMDAGTKGSVPYLDVRLRLVLRGKLFNIHLVALPTYESHTGLNTFVLISRFLDALCENWKKKMISVSTDGASNMHGRHQCAVTRLEEVCSDGFYRIWCGAHQLDLAVQAIFFKC